MLSRLRLILLKDECELEVQTKFVKGLFHSIPEDYFIRKFERLLKKEEVLCSRLCSFIKELMANSYYNREFTHKIYVIAERTLANSINYLNEVKLQFIKTLQFRKKKKLRFFGDIKTSKITTFLIRWKPREIAEQLSILDMKLFQQISIKEFANGNWLRKEKQITSPNLSSLANFFNRVSLQIVAECVNGDLKERAKGISFFIHVGKELERLKNFDMLMAVMGALNNSPVQRLKKTWQAVPNDDLVLYDELDELTSHIGNYRTYRSVIESLRAKHETFLPILSVVLRDITFTDQGNENFIENKPNFDKIFLIGNILENSIITFQKPLFNFPQNETFLKEILQCQLIDEEVLIRLSLHKEPPVNPKMFATDLDLTFTNDDLSDDKSLLTPSSMALASHISSSASSLSLSGDLNSPHLLKEDSSDNDKDEDKNIINVTAGEKRSILRGLLEKDPRSWSKLELFILLESWDLPEDRCKQLSEMLTSKSISLLKVDNKLLIESGIKEVGLRIKIKKQVDAIKEYFVIVTAYGNENNNSNHNLSSSISNHNLNNSNHNLSNHKSQSVGALSNPILGNLAVSFDKMSVNSWTIQQIKEWLIFLELPQYCDHFERNSVTGKELKDLEEADLGRIGIKPLGHRKKIYRSLLSFLQKRKHSGIPPSHNSHSTINVAGLQSARALDRRYSCNTSS